MTDFKHIEEQMAWVESEAKLYDEQGLTSDMEYGDKLFAIHRTMQSLLDVAKSVNQYKTDVNSMDMEAEVNSRTAVFEVFAKL